MSEIRNVNLPAELCVDVEKHFGQHFGSLEELLTVIMRELLREEASRADLEEERLVEQRLRELGYL